MASLLTIAVLSNQLSQMDLWSSLQSQSELCTDTSSACSPESSAEQDWGSRPGGQVPDGSQRLQCVA